MHDLEQRTHENGSSPAKYDAHDEAVFDSASPKKNGRRGKLIDQLDNDMKRLLQIEEIHQRLVKARELVANGSVHRIQLVKNHYTVDGDDGGKFLVDNGRCRCDGAQSRSSAIRGWCEHRTAVEIFKETHGETVAIRPQPIPNRLHPRRQLGPRNAFRQRRG